MRWLRRLFGEHDGPPPVTLPAPRREPKHDPALEIPADPRPDRTREEAARWRCPAMHGEGAAARACGLPKTPERTTCGRRRCKAWATRRAAATEERPKARVVAMPRRARR